MTWRLALAQLRANRGFALWTGTLMTLLVAILTYIVVMGATQALMSHRLEELRGAYAGDRFAWITVAEAEDTEHDVAAYHRMAADAFAAAIGDADAAAVTQGNLFTQPGDWSLAEDPTLGQDISVQAVTGSLDISGVVTEGTYPDKHGEIAISASVAESMNVDLGDTVTLHRQVDGNDGYLRTEPINFTVVGLTPSGSLPGYDIWMTQAFITWDDATGVDGALAYRGYDTDSTFWETQVAWNDGSAALDPYWSPGQRPYGGGIQLPQSTGVWFGAAAALFVSMIVMAFAVGRSQAAARTQWVATVRTMGARRRFIGWATVVETTVMAAAALVCGSALGLLGAQMQLSIARASVTAPFGPSRVALHWLLVPLIASVTAAVAVAIAAVPAFWASRVSPTAALKPVSDVTEAEVSRRVSIKWLWMPAVAGIALALFGARQPYGLGEQPYGLGEGLVVLGALITAVVGMALTIELLRRVIPQVGSLMARRADPAVLTAGDALTTRPRQAVAPALLMTTGVGLLTFYIGGFSFYDEYYYTEGGAILASSNPFTAASVGAAFSPTTRATLVVAALALQLVTVAIFISHQRATSREAAARRAMGLSRADETRAFWWQQWLPQTLGAVAGLALGAITQLGVKAAGAALDAEGFGAADLQVIAFGVVSAATIALAALVLAAVVAWLAVRFRARKSPVGALAPTG